MKITSSYIVRIGMIFLMVCSTLCFSTIPSKTIQRVNKPLDKNRLIKFSSSLLKQTPTVLAALDDKDAAIDVTGTFGDKVAKTLGYAMGIGAMSVYAPILITLLKNKSGEGFSTATWIFNILGFSTGIVYPLKKKFPLSTYVDLIAVVIQSIFILGMLYFFQGKPFVFGGFMISYIGIFYSLVANELPTPFLNSLQLLSTFLCNYANIPQIVLTFKSHHAAWSPITSALSLSGCLVRIFTTLQLTKDPLVLFGYAMGALTNGILLAQVFMYN